MPALSARVRSLKASVTVAFNNRAKAMKREFDDVLGFAAGEPDFDTPPRICDAAIEAIRNGETRYVPTLGDQETRGVIARKLVEENAIQGLEADHVAISVGGKHALYLAIHCLIDPPAPGEAPPEVILPVPAWVSYAPIVSMAGGSIVEVETTVDTDFLMTPEQLEDAITPRTRMLILNSPSNPCGTMYPPEHLRALAKVLERHPDIVILTDEIYEKIVYGGIEHLSIGSIDSIADRTVTVNGLSKAYAMTGWRIGYTACPGEFGRALIKAMGTLQGQMTTNITSFTYPAIRTALTSCDDDIERMREAFATRAAFTYDRVRRIDGLRCPKPTGAFYVFPDVSSHFGTSSPGGHRIESALTLAEALLEEKHVAFVPGEDFGGCGPRHVRISFACSEAQMAEGLDRFESFLASLR